MKTKKEKLIETPYKMLATKVSYDIADRMDRLAERIGTTSYRILQMMAEVFVRYMDENYNLSPDIKLIIDAFESFDGWSEEFNIADHTTRKEVSDAIYFLVAENHKGCRAVYVEKPFMSNTPQASFNTKEMLEMIVSRLFPKLYRKLRLVGAEMDCNSILEIIMRLCDEKPETDDEREIRMMFADNQRSEYGKNQHEAPTKRKLYRSANDPRLFDDN